MSCKALILTVMAVGSLVSPAATLEVGPTRAYQTLAGALAAFKSYDEIVLDDGTYTLTAADQLIFPAKSVATVRGRSGNRDAVIIDGAGAYRFIDMAANGRVTVRDLTVRNCNASHGAGVLMRASSYGNEIRNCVFRNNAAASGSGAAIGVPQGGIASMLISGCLFEDNTAGAGGAVNVGANQSAYHQTVVENCIFRRNSSTVSVWADNGEAGGSALRIYPNNNVHATIVRNCLFEANTCKVDGHSTYGAKGGGAVCSQRYGANTFKIVNCTFVKNVCNGKYAAAIGAWGRVACTDGDWGVYNCAFYGNTSGTQTEANISAPEMINDKIFNCAFDDAVFAGVGTGNRTSLALDAYGFVDYAGGDYAIGASSDLRDHGYETALAGDADALDLAGGLRRSTYGATKAIDIGAYEYGASGDAPAHDHTATRVLMGTTPTCSMCGHKDAIYCAACDLKLSGGTALAPLGHGVCVWKTVTRPSLNQDGLREQTCTVCGEVLATETTPAVGTAKATSPTAAILAAEATLGDAAGRLFVDASAETATADGTKAHPYKTLNAAFEAATSGNEIVVNHGIYSLSAPLWTDVPLTLRAASGDRDAVIVDGNGTMPILVATNTAGFVLRDITLRNGYAVSTDPAHVGLAAGVTLKCPEGAGANFLVTNIVLAGCTGKTLQGSGLFARLNGNPIKIVDSDFYENAVEYTLNGDAAESKDVDNKTHYISGASVYLYTCAPAEVLGCLFARNDMKGKSWGGAGLSVACMGGMATIRGCRFFDNVAAAGAGLAIVDRLTSRPITSFVVAECRFERNVASRDDGRVPHPWSGTAYYGGAMRVEGLEGQGRIERCVFRENATPKANQSAGWCGHGGALSVARNFVIADCLFERNYAGNGGAVVVADSAVTHADTIERCIFRENRIETDVWSGGGAISVNTTFDSWTASTEKLTVRSCLFEDNDGSRVSTQATCYGGGDSVSVYYCSTNLVFENCTFTSPRQADHCQIQGIWAEFDTYGSPLFRNCFFGGIPRNVETNKEDVFYYQARNPKTWAFSDPSKRMEDSVTYSTSEGTAFPKAGCFLCSKPGFNNATAGDYSPNKHSPLIDKGVGTRAEMKGLRDLVGGKRFRGEKPDVGACEYQRRSGLVLFMR